MRIRIVAVGRLKAGPERTLAERYAGRIEEIGRACGITALRLAEVGESAARRADDRKAEEERAIRALLPESDELIALHEQGEMATSADFAALLARRAHEGADLSFVIGGADGLSPALLQKARTQLAFGRMTLPHQLVRVLLLEQLYRSCTILINHPYHRP